MEEATHCYRCAGEVVNVEFGAHNEVLAATCSAQLRLFDLDRQNCLRVY